MNPSPELDSGIYKEKNKVDENTLLTFLSLRELEGISRKWLLCIRRYLRRYLEYVNWEITQDKTLEHLKILFERHDTSSYRKKVHQIRRFLTYLGYEWANDIRVPAEPYYYPKRVTLDDVNTAIRYFEGHHYYPQLKAIILLGATSGMRPHELYQLYPHDIDLDRRMVRINHNPINGQTTKTKRTRVSFFNEEAQQALSEYLTYFDSDSYLKKLFSKTHIKGIFKGAPIYVRDLRKFFSQEWDRRGGPTSIKKILMGHSLRKDVDLMHYNCQSEEDLKRIYDKVMNESIG